MNSQRPLVRALVYLPSLTLVLVAAALAAVSVLPFERVQVAVDAWSSKGRAESFTPTLFRAITRELRVSSLLLFVTSPLLLRYRNALAKTAVARSSEARGYTTHLWNRAVAAGRRDGGEHLAILAGIIAAGAVLRVLALSQPINYDEAFTYVTYVRRPLWLSLSDYSYANNHLLHTVLAHMSTRVFGMAPWSLRLPAFLAGCLLIPLSYLVSRIEWDRTTGLVATTLVATSEVLIAFAARARGYTLIAACFLIMLLCAHDIVRGDRRAFAPFALVASLGFFAVPIFLYPYLAITTCLLVAATANGSLRSMIRDLVFATLTTTAMVAVLYSPVMLVSGLATSAAFVLTTESPLPVLARIGQFLRQAWVDFGRGTNPFLVATLATAAIVSLLAVPRRLTRDVALAVVFWALCGTALQTVVMPPRVWLFVVPLYLGIAAAGVVFTVRGIASWYGVNARVVERIVVAALVAPLCVSAWLSRPAQYTEVIGQNEVEMDKDVEEVARYLKGRLQANDAVVSVFPTVDMLEYYFRLYEMPVESLKTRPPGTTRYLVVTNEAIGLGLDVVLAKAGLTAAVGRTAQPLMRFEYDAIYGLSAR